MDLKTPSMESGSPAPGRRVKMVAPAYRGTDVYHTLYLPTDWKKGQKYPVIIEYAGNKYKTSKGTVEGSNLGYGISGGKGAIWVCMPFVDKENQKNAAGGGVTSRRRLNTANRPSRASVPMLKEGDWEGEQLTDRLTDESLALIDQRKPGQPFYLNFWYYSVHNQKEAKAALIEKYEQKIKRMGLTNRLDASSKNSEPSVITTIRYLSSSRITAPPPIPCLAHRSTEGKIPPMKPACGCLRSWCGREK